MHDEQLQQAVARAQELIERLDGLDDEPAREEIFELLQHVDTLHREGLARLCAMLRATGHGTLLEKACDDEAVALLLGLYDLDPRSAPQADGRARGRRLFQIEGVDEGAGGVDDER